MVQIIPAVIPKSLSDLEDKVKRVVGIVPTVQIDVMDGVFVPEKSWPYTKGGPQEFRKSIENDSGLPFWDDIDYEIDLMISEPEHLIDDWMLIGARRIIVNIESTKHIRKIIDELEQKTEHDKFQFLPVEFGIALGIETPNEKIEPYIHDIDFVQLMGIETIGYQGKPFDGRVLEKIIDLKERHPHLIISIDGGVSMNSAPKLFRAGADRLVSGSAVFNSDNIRETIRRLSQAH